MKSQKNKEKTIRREVCGTLGVCYVIVPGQLRNEKVVLVAEAEAVLWWLMMTTTMVVGAVMIEAVMMLTMVGTW